MSDHFRNVLNDGCGRSSAVARCRGGLSLGIFRITVETGVTSRLGKNKTVDDEDGRTVYYIIICNNILRND